MPQHNNKQRHFWAQIKLVYPFKSMDPRELHVAEIDAMKTETEAAEQKEIEESRMHEVSGESLEDGQHHDAPDYKFGDINNWRYGIAMKQRELGVKDTWLYYELKTATQPKYNKLKQNSNSNKLKLQESFRFK